MTRHTGDVGNGLLGRQDRPQHEASRPPGREAVEVTGDGAVDEPEGDRTDFTALDR